VLTETVTALYIAVPVASAISWVPQIFRLVKEPSLGVGMSLPTWFAWSAMGLITLAYAAIVVQDVPFIVTAAVNAVGQIAVTYFAIKSRLMNRT